MCSTLLTGFPPLDSELRRLSRNSRSSSSTFLHWFASGCFVCNEEFVILTLCGSWVVIERLVFSWRDSQLGGRLDIDGRVGADIWASSSLNAAINLWFTWFFQNCEHICVKLENKSSTPPAWPASAFQVHWPPVPSLLVPPQNFSRIWHNYQTWEELFFVVDSSYIYETPTLQAFLFQAPPQRDLIKVQWWLLVQFHLFECEVGLLPDFSPRSPGQDKRTPESGSNIYVT